MNYPYPMPNPTYNTLPGVMDAHRLALSAPNFQAVLDEVGRLLEKSGLQDIVGISLLHRHNELRDGDTMVQRLQRLDDGAIALVTSRICAREVRESVCPTVWRVRVDESIEPLEYCLSSESELTDDFFVINRRTFSNVASILRRNGLEDLLGLSLLRDRALGHKADDYVAIETTDIKRKANVVTLRKREKGTEYITTLWRFDGADQQRCIIQQQCVQRSPGHDTTPAHEFVEGD